MKAKISPAAFVGVAVGSPVGELLATGLSEPSDGAVVGVSTGDEEGSTLLSSEGKNVGSPDGLSVGKNEVGVLVSLVFVGR